MKNKFLRFAAFMTAVLLCLPSAGPIRAVAADEEEDFNKWDVLEKAYLNTAYNSIEARIYAEGPDLTEGLEKKGKIRSMFQAGVSDEGYALYIDLSTGELVCLKLRRDGKGQFCKHPDYEDKPIFDLKGNKAYIMAFTGYWSTNPYSVGAIKASEKIKSQLFSQLKIEYTENAQTSTYYSFDKSALLNQLKVKNIKNGVRVEYTVGEESVKYLVPRFITADKYKALEDKVKAGIMEEKRDESEEDALWYVDHNFATYYKDVNAAKVSDADAAYIKESVEKFGTCYQIDTKFSKSKKVLKLIEESVKKYTDYTYEQLDADHEETGYVVTDKEPAVFKTAIEYTVDKDGLVVRCAAGNIRFDSGRFKLSNVFLLPNAGAGNTNNEGYALYPDGSGAIIDFADVPKDKSFITTTTAYGQDYSYSTISGANNEVSRLPVFGMMEKETKIDGSETAHGYLAYVEEGESLANIIVESSGSTHIYLRTYTSFNPRPKDTYSLSGGISTDRNASWTVESKRRYTKNYKLRIFILDEDNSSYSEMANILRTYLMNNGTLPSPEDFTRRIESEGDDIPLIIETLGAIKSSKRVLGIPVSTMKPLTSFEDIRTSIIDKLKNRSEEGRREGKPKKDAAPINNIVIKLNGWLDGGLAYNVPVGVDVEDAVGGSSGFRELISYCKANGVKLFPDFDFTYSHKDSWFDGFDPDDDLAHTIDDRKAYKKEYRPVMQAYDYSSLGVISADRMMHFYDKTYAKYKKYDVGAISVSSLGYYLNSDFNPDNPLTREDAKVLINRLLAKIASGNEGVMLSGGNVFTLKYADYITDIPLEDSRFKYATASIPFLSMVLHGTVEYSGTALNLAGDYQNEILKTIESGAVPYFIVALRNTSDLKNNVYNSADCTKYYSVRYSIWLQDIYDTYNLLNAALSDVRSASIASHEFIDGDARVAKVVYSNGCSFVVNYRDSDYTYYDEGELHTVGARNFLKFDANGKLVELDQRGE